MHLSRVTVSLLLGFFFLTGCGGGSGNSAVGLSQTKISSGVLSQTKINSGGFSWTENKPSSDTQQIYVSQSDGTDQNDCRSAATACTLSRGIGMLRDGYPDWLLIKRGDTFNGSLANGWKLSGRAATEPMVITTYGQAPARPEFHSGAEVGFSNDIHSPLRHLRLIGIAFVAHTRNPNSTDFTGFAGNKGVAFMAWGNPVEDILVEGCEIGYYTMNFVSHSDGNALLSNIRLRANYIHDSWTNYGGPNHQGFSEGMYTDYIAGLLLEQNVFDHNGGLYNYPGDSRFTVPTAGMTMSNITVTWFNHQVYSDANNKNVRVLNNIFANGDGVQVRSGGIVHGNIFVRVITGLNGGSDTGQTPDVGGFDFDIKNNLFMEGTDLPPESDTPGPRGFGIVFTNTSNTGANIEDNLFLRDQSAEPYGVAVRLIGGTCNPTTNPMPCPIRHAVVKNNFMHNWRGGIQLSGVPGTDLLDIEISGNTIQMPGSAQASLARVTSGDANAVRWLNNRYYSARTDGKWFGLEDGNNPINLATWNTAVGESSALTGLTPVNNAAVTFEEAVLGLGGTYDAAFTRLRDQTPWNWQGNLETSHLISYVRSQLGL